MSQLRCLRRTLIMGGRAIYERTKSRQLFSSVVASLCRGGLAFHGDRSPWLQFFRRVLNQLPNVAEMLLGGEHITEPDPHHGLPAQFCLGEISATGRIDPLHHLAVDDVGPSR